MRVVPARSLRIGLIGYGEVGQRLAADLAARGQRDLTAWDRLFPDVASAPAQALAAPVRAGRDLAEAITDRDLVICAVTADQCEAAAREACACLARDSWFLDLNSVAPATSRNAAHCVHEAGARYVEAAVMSPISPHGIATAILTGGPHAAAFAPIAHALGFERLSAIDAAFGRASAAKMCRSVIIKGLEALLTEALTAARFHGVEGTVIESLSDLLPGVDWPRRAHYMISRSVQHGERRAQEMQEVARTVSEAGVDPLMSEACAERQRWAGAQHAALAAQALDALLDRLLAQSAYPRPQTA